MYTIWPLSYGGWYLQDVPNKVASELKSWYGWHGSVKHRNGDGRGGGRGGVVVGEERGGGGVF